MTSIAIIERVYKITESLEIHLKGNNLTNEKLYKYTVLSDASFTTNQYSIRHVTVLAGVYY